MKQRPNRIRLPRAMHARGYLIASLILPIMILLFIVIWGNIATFGASSLIRDRHRSNAEQIVVAERFPEPLQPVTITVAVGAHDGAVDMHLYDATRTMVSHAAAEIDDGQATAILVARGALGPQTLEVLAEEGTLLTRANDVLTLDAATTVETGLPDIDRLVPMIRSFLEQAAIEYELDGTMIRGYRSPDNPLLWLRDHVYQGRGFRYFEQDVTSTLDAFRRTQRPDGSFPDVLTYPRYGVVAHRQDTESDLEYLFVQGVYEAWQMTGDDAILHDNLEAMRRGLLYLLTNPERWDEERGLVRRPYTIDTWDFQYGVAALGEDGRHWPRHWIDDQTIWGIFHGDNTGLASSLKLMERIERHLGHEEQAEMWRERRGSIMENLNRLSWNGKFFTHFVPLDETLVITAAVATDQQLSLSNALALNRQVLRPQQEWAIVQSYFNRRNFDYAFAEWYSIDPPFPAGTYGMGGKKGENPGEYVNGGILPLVGGELARGAFHAGAEDYGFDILRRYAELIRLTGASYLWYYPDGRAGISGPDTIATDGWGSSAMLGALIEGAAGIVDTASAYRTVTVSPRWAILPEADHARVVARYAASDAYVAYQWERTTNGIRLEMTGSWERARVRILLPREVSKHHTVSLRVDGQEQPVEIVTKGGRYAVAEVRDGNALLELTWVPPDTP